MKKSILITGASTGMGLADTILFAQNGYQVFATYRNDKDKGKLSGLRNVQPVKMDVTKGDNIQQTFLQISNIVGDDGLYAIINNAGIATIIAIEPDEENYEMLLKNTAGYSDIVCIRAGIWRALTNLKIVDLNFGSWAYRLQPAEQSTVRSTTIWEIIDAYNLEIIDPLKLDIEGAEKEIFETGQDEWLPVVKTIIVETHDRFKKGTAKAVFHALNQYDFDFEVKGENLMFDILS